MTDQKDSYNISGGQIGAVGPNAHAHDMTFNQIWNQSGESIDLESLASQLETLRAALRKEASEPEHDVALGAVAAAQSAAKKKDGPKTLEYLATAGKWTLDIATKIGVPIAIEALKRAIVS
jgi:hypothetical protein